MEYDLDTIEVTWYHLNDDYKSMKGETFISEEYINLNHFIVPLDADLNGFRLIFNWEATVSDTYANTLVLQAIATQDMYFIPNEDRDFETLQQALAESQRAFTQELKKLLVETPLKDIVFGDLDYGKLAQYVMDYLDNRENS